MAIKCDICKEKVNHFKTFTFIFVGLTGGLQSVAMWTDNIILQLIGMLIGLGVGLYILYTFNPSHWRHTRVTGKLLNIIAVKKH